MSNGATRRVRVRAIGEVQGVFFRSSAGDEARRLGLTGWVRNTADGAVEAEFQGDAQAVQQAVDFCRQGPRHAEVADLDVTDIDVVEGEADFQVR